MAEARIGKVKRRGDARGVRGAAGGEAREDLWRERGHRTGDFALDHEAEEVAELGFADAKGLDPVFQGARDALLGDDAHIAHDAQVDGDGLEAVRDAVMREGVLEGAGRGIVALGEIAEDGGEAGEGDEEVEVVREMRVEVEGAGDFGGEGPLPLCVGHGCEGRVLQGHGALNHAFDGPRGGCVGMEVGGEGRRVGYVDFLMRDAYALGLEGREEVLSGG